MLLAGGLFAFIFFFERHFKRADDATQPGRILPDLQAAAVTNVSVRLAGKLEISAVRTNNAWQLVKPIAYPALPAAVENLLQNFEQLTWHTRITASELKNRLQSDKEFGFASPEFSLLIQSGQKDYQIAIGSRTAFGDEVFLQVVGRDEIYLVAADLFRAIPRTANDWREPALANLKNLAFDHVTVTNGAKVFEMERTAAGKLWRLTRPLEARADNPKITALLERLEGVRFSQFVTDDPKADLETFGLQPAELELSFAQGSNVVASLQFGKSPTNDSPLVFARRDKTASIGLVTREELAPWRGAFEDFRDRHLVTLTEDSVAEVEVRGTETFNLRRQTNNVWRVTGSADLPADPALVRDLLATLGNLEVAQFVKAVVTEPDLPSYGLATPSRQIILRSSVAAGTTNNLIVQLDFGLATNGNIFVRRSDESAVYAVKLAEFQTLPAGGWQLRDRRIWNFNEAAVQRILIRENGKSCGLLRNGTNQWAFAPGSQGILNNFAIEEAAHSLGELSAAYWTARGATNRTAYGFTDNSPRVTVDVKRADKTESLTLELGGSAPSQLQYAAATLDGEPWVFELPARVAEIIRAYLSVATLSP